MVERYDFNNDPSCDQCDMIADGAAWVRASDYDALAARLAEAEPDALRYRWLMQHHGEAIRKAIDPGRPGDVVRLTDSADEPLWQCNCFARNYIEDTECARCGAARATQTVDTGK